MLSQDESAIQTSPIISHIIKIEFSNTTFCQPTHKLKNLSSIANIFKNLYLTMQSCEIATFSSIIPTL